MQETDENLLKVVLWLKKSRFLPNTSTKNFSGRLLTDASILLCSSPRPLFHLACGEVNVHSSISLIVADFSAQRGAGGEKQLNSLVHSLSVSKGLATSEPIERVSACANAHTHTSRFICPLPIIILSWSCYRTRSLGHCAYILTNRPADAVIVFECAHHQSTHHQV